jgi:hypothetical protein
MPSPWWLNSASNSTGEAVTSRRDSRTLRRPYSRIEHLGQRAVTAQAAHPLFTRGASDLRDPEEVVSGGAASLRVVVQADPVTDNLTRYFWTGERLTTVGMISSCGGGAILGITAWELWGVWGLAAGFAIFTVVVPLLAARSKPSQ